MSIRLDYEDLCGSDVIALTNLQVNRITKAYLDGKGVTIKMSTRQVVHNMKIEGGFPGFLAGLAAKVLPFLSKTVLPTLATGAVSGVRCQVCTCSEGYWHSHGKRTVFDKRLKHRKS